MGEKSFFTKAVHAGKNRTENYGAVSVPVYNASIFAFTDADEGAAIHNYQKEGYFYGRLGNPTQAALEKAVAELENGEDALAFASGMAAALDRQRPVPLGTSAPVGADHLAAVASRNAGFPRSHHARRQIQIRLCLGHPREQVRARLLA